nr:hypothetical protein [uncultured Flavobacterium sp.]
MSLLNEEQQKLFRIILDNNHEYIHGKITTERFEALGKMTQAKIDLKKSMGEEAYNNFMSMGQKLFAPKDQPSRRTTSDGDEFLDDDE